MLLTVILGSLNKSFPPEVYPDLPEEEARRKAEDLRRRRVENSCIVVQTPRRQVYHFNRYRRRRELAVQWPDSIMETHEQRGGIHAVSPRLLTPTEMLNKEKRYDQNF